jgi:predicted ATPase
MLKKLTVDNFKSLVNVTYEPGPVNLLIGANNSGKTNLCQAIRFLSLSAQMPLDDAVSIATGGSWSSVPNVYVRKETIDLSCICELNVRGSPRVFEYILSLRSSSPFEPCHVHHERLTVVDAVKAQAPLTLLEYEKGKARLLVGNDFDTDRLPQDERYIETQIPAERTALSATYTVSHPDCITFAAYLASWLYYDLSPADLRRRCRKARPMDLTLEFDGSNLASVIHSMKNLDERRYRRWLEAVRRVEPRLDAVNFIAVGDEAFMFIEDQKGNRFDLSSLSNGTLRYMALCFISFGGLDRVVDTREGLAKVSPVIIIEEPENDLYVRLLKPLMEKVEPPEPNAQYIFTTHSPYVIDLFDRYLEHITVMKWGEAYSQLTRPDPQRLQKLLETFPLGELHYREMLA